MLCCDVVGWCSGAFGLWCFWSLELNGLAMLLVSGVGWSLELSCLGVVLFGVEVVVLTSAWGVAKHL